MYMLETQHHVTPDANMAFTSHTTRSYLCSVCQLCSPSLQQLGSAEICTFQSWHLLPAANSQVLYPSLHFFAFAGSCYAFAASGSLEALIAITRDSNVTSELSEAQLVECLPTADYGCDSSGDCDGCQGGDPSEALAYALSEWDGLASAALYPYGDLIDSDTAGSCIVSS